ncbi:MAG: hypothetical protein K2J10_00065 [Muribaculaceae bacterium]|nr:hypothetical protein [Muribaculaceae bacterium]
MLRRLLTPIMMLLTFNSLSAMENNDTPTIESTDTTVVNHNYDDLFSRNIFVELGGPSLGIGIGYDQRFRPNSVFGFRAGMSFTSGTWDDAGLFGSWDGCPYTSVDFKGVTLPLEVNAIMGNRVSKFELGVGATPCILHRYETTYRGCGIEYSGTEKKEGTRLNIFGTLNVGYRLQRKSGFFLRVGLTFLIGDLKCSPIDGVICMPNLSLGYTIR